MSVADSRGQGMSQELPHFAAELEHLCARLLVMGALAEDRLRSALRGLIERDVERLAHVVSTDAIVDELQVEIDGRCFTMLALHHPVASDLRTIVSTLKISADLERVGDFAVNVGEAGQRYLLHPPVKPLIDLPRMGALALGMVRDALDAFVSKDVGLAHGVLRKDDWLDALRDQVLREVLTYMMGDPLTIQPGANLILIARHLERVGDHATNIAEDVIFMVEGRDVRHHAAGRLRPGQVERRHRVDPGGV